MYPKTQPHCRVIQLKILKPEHCQTRDSPTTKAIISSHMPRLKTTFPRLNGTLRSVRRKSPVDSFAERTETRGRPLVAFCSAAPFFIASGGGTPSLSSSSFVVRSPFSSSSSFFSNLFSAKELGDEPGSSSSLFFCFADWSRHR